MTMALILAVTRRIPEGLAMMQAGALAGLGADGASGRPHRRASGSASSAWAASGRPWRAAPAPSACRSTTTTAAACAPRSRPSSRRPGGKASTRWWRGWTSSSINCPHTPSTFHLMNARRLKLMKPTAVHREHLARRGDRRERPDPRPARRRDRRRRARRLRARPRDQPAPARTAQRRAAAAHGLGHASRAGSRWARRSSSTSRPSPTATARPIRWCRGCCSHAPGRPRARLNPDRNRAGSRIALDAATPRRARSGSFDRWTFSR